MNKVALACFATVCALASTAAAQPGAQEPISGVYPPPGPQTTTVEVVAPAGAAVVAAPQNEDWNNVSHINGTPVKVGERSQYLYTFRKTNISANPFGLFFGLYDISVSRAVSQNLAVTGALTVIDVGSSSAYQLSATVPLYFRRTFSGPFLEGGLLMRSGGNDYECDGCMDTYGGPQLLFGWHWTFDSGLNVALAAGMMKNLSESDEYDNGVEPNGYFRIGYAF
jgi:hypothetical protein